MTSDRLLYNSPRAVVDMRLLEVDDDKLFYSLDVLRTPLAMSMASSSFEVSKKELPECPFIDNSDEQEGNSSRALPRPLRCLSVSTRSSSTTSSNADDDSSSVSSVSLDDGFQLEILNSSAAPQTPAKRTIFGTYWEKKGGRPAQLLLSVPAEAKVQDMTPANNKYPSLTLTEQDSYEKLLECSETPMTTSRTASVTSSGNATGPRRRQLWDNRYVVSHIESSPALYEAARLIDTSETIRKTQSTPVVGRTPSLPNGLETRRSCLRQCRFSSNLTSSNHSQTQQQRRSSEATVVSFSEHVQVKYVKRETESFAAPGWSKHFMQ